MTFRKIEAIKTCNKSCLKMLLIIVIFYDLCVLGYGHQAPETNEGRMMCVFYSLFGVPLNAILIGALGALFSTKVQGKYILPFIYYFVIQKEAHLYFP